MRRVAGLLEETRAAFVQLGAVEVLAADAALAECDLLGGRPAEALARTDAAVTEARAHQAATVLPTLRRLRGAALLACGQAEMAVAELQAALGDLDGRESYERGFLLHTLAVGGAPAQTWAPRHRGLAGRGPPDPSPARCQ